LKFSVSRTGDVSAALVNDALIRVTFRDASGSCASVRAPVMLDVSKMERTPEEIYFFIKARTLSVKESSPTAS